MNMNVACYDPLTLLPLRNLFIDSLKEEISNAKKTKSKFAVLFIDIDNFKFINDTFGHEAGDRVLKKTSRLLRSGLFKTDTVARMGGDEFVIILSNVKSRKIVEDIVGRITKNISRPHRINGQEITVTVSIGVAIYPENGVYCNSILRNADLAMYKAKESGKDAARFFNKQMYKEKRDCYIMKRDLETALEKDEFFLCYQPIFDIKSSRVSSMEALIRWQRPKNRVISPMDFIGVAEETMLIVPIGLWVIQKACSSIKCWRNSGIDGFSISVNVSAVQIQQEGFAESALSILEEAGIDSRYIELEITESVAMKAVDIASDNVAKLKAGGLKISMDDFGSGYSSFNYLKNFKVNSVKIDRSFVSNINKNVDSSIIDAIILLGHSLDLDVVAEGVETHEQLFKLLNKGCDKAQGYLFSRPLSETEVPAFFTASAQSDQWKFNATG